MEQIGRRIIHLESVDSTNNYTANVVRKGELEHGSVILAVDQHGGRGQMGAGWLANPGENLTFSIFLDDVNMAVENQFGLTVLTSLSLVDFFSKFGLTAKIKWPNDIYVDDLKIAGVLIENTIQGNAISKSIVGIGINVNQAEFDELAATSMKSETGMHQNLDELILSFVSCFNERLKGFNYLTSKEEYMFHLYWIHEERYFEDEEGLFQGQILDVDEGGYLRVLKREEVKRYSLKEVRFKH